MHAPNLKDAIHAYNQVPLFQAVFPCTYIGASSIIPNARHAIVIRTHASARSAIASSIESIPSDALHRHMEYKSNINIPVTVFDSESSGIGKPHGTVD